MVPLLQRINQTILDLGGKEDVVVPGRGKSKTADFKAFGVQSLACGAMIIVGFIFQIALGVLLCFEFGGCLFQASCLARALNIVFATLASKF